MDRLSRRRWLEIAIWGSILATLVVCAIGGLLTAEQHRDLGATLLESERRAARGESDRIESRLRDLASTALAREFDASPPSGAPPSPELFHTTFAVAADGTITAPGLRSLSLPEPAEQRPPPRFGALLREIDAGPPRGDAGQTLVDGLATPWRARADILRAAWIGTHGDTKRAERLLASVLTEQESELRASDSPPFEAILLAHADLLGRLGRIEPALDAIRRGARHLAGCGPLVRLSRCELFLERSRAVTSSLGAAPPDELLQEASRLETERSLWRATRAAAELLRARARLAATERGPRHDDEARTSTRFLALANSSPPSLIAWRHADVSSRDNRKGAADSSPPRAREPIALARHVALDRLAEWISADMDAHGNLPGLRAVVGPFDEAAWVQLGRLSGELDLIQLVRDRLEWERTVDRTRRPFLLAGVLIAVLGALLIAGLVFLRSAIQRELALARMKTEFVANVSHELKTPLALIRLCSETLELDRVPSVERRGEYYRIITRESERLSRLISNVLSYASIEAGKKSYELATVDLATVARETAESYFIQFREQGFDCAHTIPESLPTTIADGEAIAQALINLLQNAVRYSPETRWIRVGAESRDGAVCIWVEDRGVGISREDQPRIWNDYYRTREARALGTRGSGLGLSLVLHIVRAHDGRVELESEPGRGSRFTLVIPLEAGRERRAREATQETRRGNDR